MKWKKVITKAVVGAIEGGIAGTVITGGDIGASSLTGLIVGILRALVNWFKNK